MKEGASNSEFKIEWLYLSFIGGIDCLQNVSEEDVEWAMSLCKLPNRSGSEEFDAFAETLFVRNGRIDAFTWQQAMDNYILLVNASSWIKECQRFFIYQIQT